MKISCQSCQAKYTIADEKVLGKIVKIRCKKCGATIVINGNESGASTGGAGSGGEQAAAFDYGAGGAGGDTWTVNVADGDQRTMTTEELTDAFRTGTINDETYCWKDGMVDWMPIREVPELASLSSGGGASPDATHQDQSAQSPLAGAFAGIGAPDQEEATNANQSFGGAFPAPPGSSPNGNGAAALFGGSNEASPSGAPAAARRQGGRAGGGMDLFGNVTHAGGEDDVMTSAPRGALPQASNDEPGKLTGQRNENSVLFSLNALTQNAPKEEAPQGPGEGSGLIDIRALSASMGDKSSEKRSHVDDIMNLGGGGAFSAALAAPVLAPPAMDGGGGGLDGSPRKDNTKVIVGAIIGAGLLIAIALILMIVLRSPSETTPTPTAMATDTASAAAPAAPAAPDTTVATAPAGTQAAAPAGGDNTAPTAPGDSNRHTGGGGGGAVAANAKHHGGGGGGNDDSTPAPKPFVAPTPAPAAGGGGGGGSLDDQIRKSMGGGAPAPIAAAPQQSSAPFDRGAAAAALGSVNVAGCKKSDGPTGSGHIKVTFGPSGSVSSAVVDQAPFAGTGVGGCVAGKFRGAHIPAFGGSPVTVGKSFMIE